MSLACANAIRASICSLACLVKKSISCGSSSVFNASNVKIDDRTLVGKKSKQLLFFLDTNITEYNDGKHPHKSRKVMIKSFRKVTNLFLVEWSFSSIMVANCTGLVVLSCWCVVQVRLWIVWQISIAVSKFHSPNWYCQHRLQLLHHWRSKFEDFCLRNILRNNYMNISFSKTISYLLLNATVNLVWSASLVCVPVLLRKFLSNNHPQHPSLNDVEFPRDHFSSAMCKI